MPAADGVDREIGRVMIDADAHAADIRADVVDAIGNGFAEFFIDEVMHVDLVGSWLEPERRLEALRSLQVDALTWDRNGREVAFLNHGFFSGPSNHSMDKLFEQYRISRRVPAGGTNSGFVFTNLSEGVKYVNVELWHDKGVIDVRFYLELPNGGFDYEAVDFERLYTPGHVKELNLAQLRRELASVPCCTGDGSGSEAAQSYALDDISFRSTSRGRVPSSRSLSCQAGSEKLGDLAASARRRSISTWPVL